jgi:enoyl-CoA hydratase
MTDSDLVLTTRDGDVALLTLNRPDKRNAFDAEMTRQFAESFRACRDAACIVITGTDPAFCSGADLRADADSLKNSGYPIGWQEIVDSPVPVIAAVNGPAVTGGFALAVNADFIIASERASFCDNELLVIGYGNAQLMAPLQRRVGDAWARELSLTSEYIDAATALRIGLVNHVVPHEELLPRALEAARAIAAKDRRAVSAMRQQWDAQQGLPLRTSRRLHDSFHEPFKDAVTAFADEERVKQLVNRASARSWSRSIDEGVSDGHGKRAEQL